MRRFMSDTSREIFESIASSLREAGYDPFSQITGYLQTGDLTYITRSGDSRSLIVKVDKTAIRKLLAELDN